MLYLLRVYVLDFVEFLYIYPYIVPEFQISLYQYCTSQHRISAFQLLFHFTFPLTAVVTFSSQDVANISALKRKAPFLFLMPLLH
jgi:hypothetical protein